MDENGEKPDFSSVNPIITPAMREAVKTAAGLGLPVAQIARLIVDPVTLKQISPKTLERRFRNELEDGIADANRQVSSKLFTLCMQGNFHAIKWWEQTRQHRYEPKDFRDKLPSGVTDVSPEHLASLSKEQIRALEGLLKTVAGGAPPVKGQAPRLVKADGAT